MNSGTLLEAVKTLKLLILLVLLAGNIVSLNHANILIIATADEDEYGEGYGDDDYEGEAEELAEEAGSVAWTGGIAATLAFVLYKHAYPRLVKAGIKPPVNLRQALDLHILLSVVLGALALYHGYMLRSYAGPIEYVATGLIIVLLVSGFTLRYVKSRYVKMFSRIIHAQRLLSILLIIAILVHTATIDD